MNEQELWEELMAAYEGKLESLIAEFNTINAIRV